MHITMDWVNMTHFRLNFVAIETHKGAQTGSRQLDDYVSVPDSMSRHRNSAVFSFYTGVCQILILFRIKLYMDHL